MNVWVLCIALAAIGSTCLFLSWGLVYTLIAKLNRHLAQQPALRDEVALAAELERLRLAVAARVQERVGLDASLVELREAQAAAAAEAASVQGELRQLRVEKRELVDRVREFKEEAHVAERALADARTEAGLAEKRRERWQHEVGALEPQGRDLRVELERLRAEIGREESHAAALRRQREVTETEGAHRLEALKSEIDRMDAALIHKNETLSQLNRSISEAESRLNRYQ